MLVQLRCLTVISLTLTLLSIGNAKLPPCRMAIFEGTTDPEDAAFLQHIEEFLKNHRMTEILSSLLDKGVLSMGIRFYINPLKKHVIFNPDYLMLDVRVNVNNQSNFFVKELHGVEAPTFIHVLKKAFLASYYNSTVNKMAADDFSDMLDDKVIHEYYMLRVVMTPPLFHYILMDVTASGPNVKVMEIASKDEGEDCKVPREKLPPTTFKRGPGARTAAQNYRIYNYFLNH